MQKNKQSPTNANENLNPVTTIGTENINPLIIVGIKNLNVVTLLSALKTLK